MRLLARIAAALAIILALAAPALAQEVSAEQKQALVERVDSFHAAMAANDMRAIMGVIPPKVLEKVAGNFGVTVEQLIEATQQQMDEALKTVTIVSFGMDLETAEFFTLADGTTYALIPSETVIDMGAAAGGKIRATTSTLGLLDGLTWYLVRIDDAAQVAILKEVYPALADVEFPTGTTEPVTE
jgi:hypothetical protein